jgi:hypothetical protein
MPKRKPGTGRMFAVVDDLEHAPVFVKQGSVGFWPCKANDHVAWAHMHLAQGAVVTEAALRASMIGWGNPAAQPAINWKGPGSDRPVPDEDLTRALSIRQPLSELILIGAKKKEYRSRRTLIRERVYLYAGKKIAHVDGFPEEEAAVLPRGVIVGSIEIVGCHENKKDGFVWLLDRPVRYPTPLVPRGVPQPGFWRPKF